MKTVIAFDVSKGNSVIVAYDENKQYIFESKINHTNEGFILLQEKINYLLETYDQTPEFVLESTGVYSNCIEHYLSELNYSYCALNPLEASFQTKVLRRNKTDISDAHMLAKTHFSAKRRPKYQQDKYYVEMRAMSRHYHDIESEKGIYKNRIHKLLQETFPEFEKFFKNKSVMFYKVIQEFPHAESVIRSSKTIVDYYYKLKRQPYSKHHKVATVACINKFLKIMHHLIIHGKYYDNGETRNVTQP